jgi:hypothetical protein
MGRGGLSPTQREPERVSLNRLARGFLSGVSTARPTVGPEGVSFGRNKPEIPCGIIKSRSSYPAGFTPRKKSMGPVGATRPGPVFFLLVIGEAFFSSV